MSDTHAEKNPIAPDRNLAMELVRVTERAAVSSARLRGRGDEKGADQAAVDAMRRELNRLPIHGRVVIGEGERDEAPMLFIGEEVGTKTGPKVDIAVDPLEGTTLCAKDMPGSIAVMAMAQAGSLLNAPDVYMDKIAVGPGYPDGVVALDRSPTDNIHALAKAKGVAPGEITVVILDRPRHADLIAQTRATGAAIRLLTDGDVDTVELLGLVIAIIPPLLVENGVDGDSSFTGLTVTNNQLTLATADGHHGVDRLDTSHHGLVDGATRQDTGSLDGGTATLSSLDGPFAINGVTESIDDTAKELGADWDIDNLAGTLDGGALLDETIVIEDGDIASRLKHVPRTPEENSTISSAINLRQ